MKTFNDGDHVLIDGPYSKWAKGFVWVVLGKRTFSVAVFDSEYEDGDIYEDVVDPNYYYCVMVGDDEKHAFHVDDMTLYEDNVCSCGQVGCLAEVF